MLHYSEKTNYSTHFSSVLCSLQELFLLEAISIFAFIETSTVEPH